MFRENEIVPFEEKSESFFRRVSREKVSTFVREANISIGSITAADFLRSLNVAGRSVVTNTGILFFAKNVREHIRRSPDDAPRFQRNRNFTYLTGAMCRTTC